MYCRCTVVNYLYFYRLSRDYGPVVDFFVLFHRIVLISSPADVKEILLRRPKVFRRGLSTHKILSIIGMKESIFIAEGTEWMKHRKLVGPPFSRKNITSMFDTVLDEVDRFIESLVPYAEKNETVDMIFPVSALTIRVIGKKAFGLEEKDDSYFFSDAFFNDLQTMQALFFQKTSMPIPDFLWNLLPRYKYKVGADEALIRIEKCASGIIKKALNAKTDAKNLTPLQHVLIHHLLAAKELTNAEIIGDLIVFFIGGVDTTTFGTNWTLYFLLLHPEVLAAAREEADSVDFSLVSSADAAKRLRFCHACFYEALRLRGPFFIIDHALVSTRESFTLASGVELFPSDDIYVHLDAAKLDPILFENPKSFNPSRWLIADEEKLSSMRAIANLTWGSGPRICPGMDLAQAEGTFAIAKLLRSFTFELDCPVSEIERTTLALAVISKLPLKLRLRKGAS